MWPGRQPSFSSKTLERTGLRESVCNVSGVMNCGAGSRHHHMHLVAALHQFAHEIGRFVGGDGAGDADDDACSWIDEQPPSCR